MANFRVIVGPDKGQVFCFSDRLSFGRSKSMRFDHTSYAYLSDPRISREHLVVYRDGEDYYAIDKYSSNGSYIEGQRLKPNQTTLLHDQAQVRLGSTILTFDTESIGSFSSTDNLQPSLVESSSKQISPSMIINAQEWLDVRSKLLPR